MTNFIICFLNMTHHWLCDSFFIDLFCITVENKWIVSLVKLKMEDPRFIFLILWVSTNVFRVIKRYREMGNYDSNRASALHQSWRWLFYRHFTARQLQNDISSVRKSCVCIQSIRPICVSRQFCIIPLYYLMIVLTHGQ